AGVAVDEIVDADPGNGRLNAEQIGNAGLGFGVETDFALAIGHRRANLLGGHRRSVEQVVQSGVGGGRFAHLRRRVGQVVDLGGDLGYQHVRNDESVWKPGVEAL